MADNEKLELENQIAELQNNTEKGVKEKSDETEKFYTEKEVQQKINSVINQRLGKEKEKSSKLREKNIALEENSKVFKALSKILEDKAGFKGSPREQLDQTAKYYGISENDLNSMLDSVENGDKSEKEAIAYFNAQRFLEKSDPEEIEEEFKRINSISPSRRTIKDRELLEVITPHITKKQIEDDKRWFEKEVGGDFESFISSDEFREFYDGMNVPVRTAIEKYVRLKGKSEFTKSDNKEKKPISTGSAKDTGGTRDKDYYSATEVDNLKEEDIDDETLEKIIKSMSKW